MGTPTTTRRFGWALAAALVALAAIFGGGGSAAAQGGAQGAALVLRLEARLCATLPEPTLTNDIWHCDLAGVEEAVVEVKAAPGPKQTVSLPITSALAYTGQAPFYAEELDLPGNTRTVRIKQIGPASYTLGAVDCAWFNTKPAWERYAGRLPQRGQTAKLEWAPPAPHSQYPVAGLHCWLLFTPA